MKKNKKIIVVVFVMLLTVSIALAYFVGRTLLDGKGASTTVTTANIHGATLKIEGELNFNAEGMLPGHRDISRIKVTATGNNELIPYNLVWTGTNSLVTNLKFTVYKTSSQIETSSNCKKHDEQVSGGRKLYETCEIKNENQMGEVLTTGTIISSEESIKVELAKDEFINATPDGQVVYYYIIIEYPNEANDQYPKDKGGSFNGVINAEASDTKPDINIIAAYIEQEDRKYEKTDDIPQTGYTINKSKSICNNNAIPGYDYENKRVYFEKLTKSGTECELYFDKNKQANEVLAYLKLEKSKEGCPQILNGISQVTGTEESKSLICSAPDDDGESYYFRGTTNNNWVKFGKTSDNKDIYWRIIRINGDGSIRLIYSGEEGNFGETGNGTNAITNVAYNDKADDNTYLGYYNAGETTSLYPYAHEGTKPSTMALAVNDWFTKTNLDESLQLNHIDENAGFCNDRKISNDNHGDSSFTNKGYGTEVTWYAGFDRLMTEKITAWKKIQNPTYKCSNIKKGDSDYNRDYYTWKGHANQGNKLLTMPVGLITMDELIYAGGFASNPNTSYWLYINESFRTMTPRNFEGNAYVFHSTNDGIPNNGGIVNMVSPNPGARPVINLKSSTKFTFNNPNGNDKGTKGNPYIVTD